MSNIKAKWDEFLTIIDSSADTELAIVAAMVIPTLVWVSGAWITSQLDVFGPFATLTQSLVGRLDLVFVGLAAFFYWKLGTLAASSYRRARRRHFEQENSPLC